MLFVFHLAYVDLSAAAADANTYLVQTRRVAVDSRVLLARECKVFEYMLGQVLDSGKGAPIRVTSDMHKDPVLRFLFSTGLTEPTKPDKIFGLRPLGLFEHAKTITEPYRPLLDHLLGSEEDFETTNINEVNSALCRMRWRYMSDRSLVVVPAYCVWANLNKMVV
jgi:hypothetical protein